MDGDIAADACGATNVCLDGDREGAVCADFQGPIQFSLALDASGNLFVASHVTSSVFRVSPGGCVTTVLDADGGGGVEPRGARGLSVAADGTLFVANGASNTVFRVTPEGVRRKVADLQSPLATAVDADGNAFVSLQGEARVAKMPATGGPATTVLDGTGDGMGRMFGKARGIAVDADGNLYAASEATQNVFRVTPEGVRTEIVSKQRAQDVDVALDGPFGVAVDAAGSVFVTGFQSDSVVRVSPSGEITELMREGVLDGPREVAVDAAGRVYVTGQRSSNLVRLTPNGTGWTQDVLVQGTPEPGSSATVAPPNATLTSARGLAVGADGRAFVAGEDSHTVYGIATAPSACGDGTLDAGEDCDWARQEDRCCCNAQCRLAEASAPCTDGIHCNGDDRCGDAGRCSVHTGTPCAEAAAAGVSTGVCNEDSGGCDPPTGDSCEDGNPCNGPDVVVDDVCTPTNLFASPGVSCVADDNPCTRDQCDGSGVCLAITGDSGVKCRPATDCRDEAECTADSSTCPEGAPKPDGVACDATGCTDGYAFCESGECVCYAADCGNGVQDPGEQCGEPGLGGGECCSNCRLRAAGTVCRNVDSTCDVEEKCDGVSASCPDDRFAPPDTSCDDGNPCTADTCSAGACQHVTICAAELERRDRIVGRRALRADELAATVLCTNPDPTARRAVTCTPRAVLPSTGTAEDCRLQLPGSLVSQKTRRRVRKFSEENTGGEEIAVKLRFNDAAIGAIRKAFEREGRTTILVCVDFAFTDGTTATVVRELNLTPGGKLKTRLPGSTPP